MINNRSDYKYVTGLDNIIINGQIMPLRSADESNHIRGEDIAFISEAYCELRNDINPDYNNTISFDNRISFNQVYSVIPVISSAIDSSAPLYEGRFVEIENSQGQTILDALGLTYIPLPDITWESRKIRSEEIVKAFEQIRLSRRLWTVSNGTHSDVRWYNRVQGNAIPEGIGQYRYYDTPRIRVVNSRGERLARESSSNWRWYQEGYYWSCPDGPALVNYKLPKDYNNVWVLWTVNTWITHFDINGDYGKEKTFALVEKPDTDLSVISRDHTDAMLNSYGTWWKDLFADTDTNAAKMYPADPWVQKIANCGAELSSAIYFVIDVSDRIRF